MGRGGKTQDENPTRKSDTRERILAAAVKQFSRHSYESTGLRDIAAAAEVDVAYVHRCFGSKAQLFAEAVKASVQLERCLGKEDTDPADALATELFTKDAQRIIDPDRAGLDIMLRSISSPEAAAILRENIHSEVIAPLVRRLGDSADHRAALVMAFLFGTVVLRRVLQIEPLTEPPGGKLEVFVRSTLDHLINDTPTGIAASKKAR